MHSIFNQGMDKGCLRVALFGFADIVSFAVDILFHLSILNRIIRVLRSSDVLWVACVSLF